MPHLLIIEARFYDDIADELMRGAVGALERAGATYERITVPGARGTMSSGPRSPTR